MNCSRQARLATLLVSVVVMVTGCTAGDRESTPPAPSTTATTSTPSATGTASAAAVPTVIVQDLPPITPAKARVVVDDPSLVQYQPGGPPPSGPVTFSVSGDEIVIDDQLREQSRLFIYRDGRKVRTLRSDDWPLDLRVEGNRYWRLGDDAVEYVLKDGSDRLTEVRRVSLPPDSENAPVTGGDIPDDYVQWSGGRILRSDTGLFAVPDSGPTILLEGTGPDPSDYLMSHKGTSLVIKDPGFTAEIRTRSKGEEPDATLLSRYGGRVFYKVTDGVGPNWGYIYEFTTTGALLHTYTLHEGFIKTPNRTIVITDDGQVYQLVISTKTARVLHIPPN